MGQRKRTDDGRFTETVTPERVLDALVATAAPVATASDVAGELGCTREAARVKLVALKESGDVERKKVGGAAVVWWLNDEERATTGVDPDDGFWDAEPGTSAEPTDAAKTDEYLADALADE